MNGNAPKLALVTGGTQRLGAVIAAQLADEGYTLALSSSDAAAKPEAALAEIFAKQDSDWQLFSADLSDTAAAPALIADVTKHFGRAPDLLVNNAAIFGQDQWPEMDAASLQAHFDLNFFAPVLLANELVKQGSENARPAIIHILDQRIRNPNGDQLSYTLAKQALAASVRSLASAFGRRARVNAVAPGLVISTDDYDDAQMERLNDMMPLGKLPSPQSVARAVSYLAAADDVTGQIIFADGGANLKSYKRDFLYL